MPPSPDAMPNRLQQYNPDHMLAVMNTYAGAFPNGFILARNRRGCYHLIIPASQGQLRPTFTSYECLVRFMDRQSGTNSNNNE